MLAVTGKLSDPTESVITGAGRTPVPVSVTACGEPMALSAKLSDAESVPPAAGLYVAEAAQEAPAAVDAPQMLVWANEETFVPVMMALRMAGPDLGMTKDRMRTPSSCRGRFIRKN